MAIQFSDTTNKNGLVQACEDLCFGGEYTKISGNTNLLARFTRYINDGLNRVQSVILASDTRWQFDDSNYTDYPIGNTDLVAGQQDYTLDDAQMKIEHVYVKDANGDFRVVLPIDELDIKASGVSPTEFMESDGLPKYYDKKANALFLYPAPAAADVTTSGGLRVAHQRGPSYFATSDTTKSPGIPELYHALIYRIAAFNYFIDSVQTSQAKNMKVMIEEEEERIKAFYNTRDKDDRPQLRVKRVSYV